MLERLQKIIARAGIASRRHAEERLARVVILSEAGARFAFGPFSVRAARSEESLSSSGGSPGAPGEILRRPAECAGLLRMTEGAGRATK